MKTEKQKEPVQNYKRDQQHNYVYSGSFDNITQNETAKKGIKRLQQSPGFRRKIKENKEIQSHCYF